MSNNNRYGYIYDIIRDACPRTEGSNMSYMVRHSKQQQDSTSSIQSGPVSHHIPEAIEEAHYPNEALVERRNSVKTTSNSSSTSSNCFVQSTLVLVPVKDQKSSLWRKTKAAFGYTPPKYQVFFLQEQEDKPTISYTLYGGDDASDAMNAFDRLNATLAPLMRDGSVLLNEAILRKIILPKPLQPSEISFSLVEVMEVDPRAHPEWLKLLQALLHSACSRENKNEIKLLLNKGGNLEQEDNDGNTPIHTAAFSSSKECMNWLLSIAAPSFSVNNIIDRRNSEGLSPIDIARGSRNIGAVHALMMMKQAMPQVTKLDLFEDDMVASELHEAVDVDNSEQIWEYCNKVGLTSVHIRGRRKAVSLRDLPLLKKQNTVDVMSQKGTTPLTVAIEKQYIKSTLLLLISGADPDQHHPETGDTPLHSAVAVGNLTIIKMLLVFGADPTLCNKDGITSLQLSKDLNKDEGNKLKIMQTLEEMALLQEKTWNYFSSHNNVPETRKEKETYLLALDGGGIRSFNTCQAFIAIEDRMKQIEPHCHSFFSYFDYIAGTSAGGIVALISTYTDAPTSISRALIYKIVTDVFSNSKCERGKLMDKYLQETLGEDTRMSHPIDQRLIITTTLANVSPSKLHLMTNYGGERDGQAGPSERRLWEAAKATSAAPYFFPTFQGKFLDGGIMANNPTLDAMVEIQNQAEVEEKEVKMGCVLSLGTGFAPAKSIDNIEVFMPCLNFKTITSLQETLSGLQNLLNLFVTQVTQSDGQEVQRAKTWCKSLGTPYFRLSPPLLEEIDPLSFNDKAIVNMLYEDKKYLLDQPQVIDSIAKCLLSKKLD